MEKSSFHSRYDFRPWEVELGHSKVVVLRLLQFHVLFRSAPPARYHWSCAHTKSKPFSGQPCLYCMLCCSHALRPLAAPSLELLAGAQLGHPQTCVYPDVCLGIGDVSGKVPLPRQGPWQIHKASALAPYRFLGRKRKGEGCSRDTLSQERGFTRYKVTP